jgi:hypothetical protein
MVTGALAEGVGMLVIDDLGEATVERAGALLAREHAAARQLRPELPAGFGTAEVCAAALQRLRDSGHASLPAEGFAADPDLADPTGVLAAHSGTWSRR